MPGGARQQDGGQQEKPRFGPPAKKGGGAVVGIIIGVVALILIIVVVFAASGKSPMEEAKAQRDADTKAKNAETEANNVTQDQENARVKMAEDACKAFGPKIVAAINAENDKELAGMFDWGAFVTALQKIEAKGVMPSKLYFNGEWEVRKKDDTEALVWVGTGTRSTSDLQTSIMDWIAKTGFGSTAVYNVKKSEDAKSRIGWTLDGKPAIAYKLAIKVGSRSYEYTVACPTGTSEASIVYFDDGGAQKKIKDAEKSKRKKAAGGGGQDLSNTNRKDPESGSEENPELEPEDAVVELPEAKATGVSPEHPDLINMVKYVCVYHNSISDPYKNKIRGKSAADKKRALGAFIDYLLIAHNENDRKDLMNISSAMYSVWEGFVPTPWVRKDMTFNMRNGQIVGGIDVVRRWIDVYNNSYNESDK